MAADIKKYVDELEDVFNKYPKVTSQLTNLVDIVMEDIEIFLDTYLQSTPDSERLEDAFSEMENSLDNLSGAITAQQEDLETAADAEDADEVREQIDEFLGQVGDLLYDEFSHGR